MHIVLSFPLGLAVWSAALAVWPDRMTILAGPFLVSGTVVLASLFLPGR